MLYQLAENFIKTLFEKKNITVLAQNFRGVGFEIDLIVQDKIGNLIAVEVKFRKDLTRNLDRLIPTKKLAALYRGLSFYEHKNFEFVQNKRIDLAVVGEKNESLFLYKYIVGN